MWQEVAPQGPAMTAAATCDALELAGHSDWQLPSVIELLTVVDEARTDPAYDPSVFIAAQSGAYFASSTPNLADANQRWSVHMFWGEIFARNVTDNLRTRCVRRLPLE